ncbi:MAG: MFS transporter, partial [Rhodoglobus sp.]|nr:MFS transporter [Rhodoglobus sp.]
MAARNSTRPAGPPQAGAVAWRNAIFVVFGLGGIALASWVSRLPAVRDTLELSPAQVGALLFGMAAGSIIGLTASSHIVVRLGAKSTMMWGTIVAGTGVAIAGTGGSFS